MDGGFVGEVNRGRHRNAWAWDMQRGGRRAYKDVEVAGVDKEPKEAGVPVVLATDEWVEIHEGPVIASDGPVVEVIEHLPEPEQTPTVTSNQHRPKTEGEDGSNPAHGQYAYGSPWPEWVKEFRENQIQALEDVRKAYGQGADVVFLDAPTGAGKTLLGEAIRRELQVNGLYVCSGKTLQDQFVRDFPYSAVIKGRSNYIPTHAGDEWGVEVTCADCDKRRVGEIEWECSHCEEVNDCPYGIAKGMAAISEVAVANTTYMLHEANYTRDGLCSGREFVVVDEADVLEKELMRFVEFSIGKHQVAQLGVQPPKKGSHTTTIIKWIEDDLTEAITKKLEGLRGSPRDVRIRRRKEAYETMRGRAKQVAQEMREYDGGWVRDNDAGPLVMKPVDVAWAAPNLLWKHSNKWMLMSATIISAEEMVESLGIEQAGEDSKGLTWDVVEVPMSFPVENRRIHAIPMANMVAKEKATAWPQMGDALCRVVDRHLRERILVHCVSFELGRSLSGRLLGHLSHHRDNQMFDTENNPTSNVEGERAYVGDRPVITYGSGQGERDQAVAKFRSQEGAVLIAPSLDRGVDLREDDCRVVVVCKVPFPYLGDKQVAARANAGRKGRMWYAVQTVRTLVQMTGRHVRSEEDWGVTYILDKQFVDNIYARNKVLFPRWWRKAVKVESRRWLEDGNG